jgi:hypothetical protein
VRIPHKPGFHFERICHSPQATAAVHKSATDDLEQAPLQQIGLIANESLRVEPYAG